MLQGGNFAGQPQQQQNGSPGMCIRSGCNNPTMDSPGGWDNEYCSNDCVVNNCRYDNKFEYVSMVTNLIKL